MAKSRELHPSVPAGLVRVHFTGECIYRGVTIVEGEEINVEPHEADSIEAFKVGYRLTTPSPLSEES